MWEFILIRSLSW